MTVEERKDQTLEIQMDSMTLDMMERAREYLKLDKSKFIRQSIRQLASSVLVEHEKTRLSKEDWKNFFAMIENPPELSERAKKAAKKYKEIMSQNEI